MASYLLDMLFGANKRPEELPFNPMVAAGPPTDLFGQAPITQTELPPPGQAPPPQGPQQPGGPLASILDYAQGLGQPKGGPVPLPGGPPTSQDMQAAMAMGGPPPGAQGGGTGQGMPGAMPPPMAQQPPPPPPGEMDMRAPPDVPSPVQAAPGGANPMLPPPPQGGRPAPAPVMEDMRGDGRSLLGRAKDFFTGPAMDQSPLQRQLQELGLSPRPPSRMEAFGNALTGFSQGVLGARAHGDRDNALAAGLAGAGQGYGEPGRRYEQQARQASLLGLQLQQSGQKAQKPVAVGGKLYDPTSGKFLDPGATESDRAKLALDVGRFGLEGARTESEINTQAGRLGLDTSRLSLDEKRAAVDAALGMGRLGVEQGQLGVSQQNAATQRALGFGNLDVAQGQLGVAEQNAATQRALGFGNLGVARDNAETSRLTGMGNLGVAQQNAATGAAGLVPPDIRALQGAGIDPRSPDAQKAILSNIGGRGQTNINMGGEGAEQRTVGEGVGKEYLELRQGAKAAAGTLGTLGQMDRLAGQIESGPGSGAVDIARRLGSLVGVDSALPERQAFEALSNKLVLDQLGGSLGAGVSNADTQFLKDTVPKLSNTPEANRYLIEAGKRLAQRKIEAANAADQFRAQAGSLVGKLPDGRTWPDVLAEMQGRSITEGLSPPSGGAVSQSPGPQGAMPAPTGATPSLLDQMQNRYGF